MLSGILMAVLASAPFAATGDWVPEKQPSQCVVRRDLRAGDAELTVRLHRMPESANGSLTLSIPASERPKPNGKARIEFGDGLPAMSAAFAIRTEAATGLPVTSILLKRDELARVITAPALTVSGASRKPLSLGSGGSARTQAALDDCGAALLAAWGIDPAAVAAVATPAVGSPALFITNADYPREAMAARQQGTGVMLWQIGVDGMAHDCRTVETSGWPLLDAAGCNAMTSHGRWLTPALDKDGKPVPSWGRRVMRWQLPQAAPRRR